jgi:hypothetical protein
MAEKKARLADFGNMAEAKSLVTMADLENEEVEIMSFTLARGEHGNFATLKVTRASGEIVTVRTASAYILAALKEAKIKNAFPVAAVFTQHGKTWLVD